MKTYITFGQAHIHKINNKIFDKDCIAVIECNTPEEGRKKAFEIFGTKFCFEYPESYFDHSKMNFFPRGYIKV